MSAASEFIFKNRMMSMTCTFESEGVAVVAARVDEGMSQITLSTVEFICRNRALPLADVVGTAMSISMETASGDQRSFQRDDRVGGIARPVSGVRALHRGNTAVALVPHAHAGKPHLSGHDCAGYYQGDLLRLWLRL